MSAENMLMVYWLVAYHDQTLNFMLILFYLERMLTRRTKCRCNQETLSDMERLMSCSHGRGSKTGLH